MAGTTDKMQHHTACTFRDDARRSRHYTWNSGHSQTSHIWHRPDQRLLQLRNSSSSARTKRCRGYYDAAFAKADKAGPNSLFPEFNFAAGRTWVCPEIFCSKYSISAESMHDFSWSIALRLSSTTRAEFTAARRSQWYAAWLSCSTPSPRRCAIPSISCAAGKPASAAANIAGATDPCSEKMRLSQSSKWASRPLTIKNKSSIRFATFNLSKMWNR